jgi:hypothetical protein
MASQLVALFFALFAAFADAFVNPNVSRKGVVKSYSSSSTLSAVTTLTEETSWKLRFLLQDLPTEQGKKVNEMLFSVDAYFIEEEGYEPPQGDLKQIFSDESETSFKVSKSRWLLSEDPTERKDGLWIWGLFKEPLYPFLLLQLETERVPLPGEEGDAIKPLKLFAQLNHQREKEVGVVLKGGELKVREMETLKADPFGASTIEVYEEVSIGKLNIEPMV